MKKSVFSAILAMLLACAAAGCGRTTDVSIEDCPWTLATVQDGDGIIIAASVDYLATYYVTADEADVTCEAAGGELEMTNCAAEEAYEGTYVLKSSNARSAVYTVEFGKHSGRATTAYTTYQDGSKVPTLVMSIDGYTMYFYE